MALNLEQALTLSHFSLASDSIMIRVINNAQQVRDKTGVFLAKEMLFDLSLSRR